MKAKGFTLIELAVVLAVIAVLAAVLTPLVTSYIDQARETRAEADVRAIGQSYLLHKRDTGHFPIYTDAPNATADTSVGEVLLGDGDVPGDEASDFILSGMNTTDLIDTYLNQNQLSLPTTARGGRTAYRGPYLDSISADPWGNAFVVNINELERSSANIGFVISAGPDGALDTDKTQAKTGAFTVGDDDIAFRIN